MKLRSVLQSFSNDEVRARIKYVASVAATLFVATLVYNLSPVYLGAVTVSFGLSESQVGLIVSTETLTAAATSMLLISRFGAVGPRRPAMIGISIFVLAQVMSLFPASLPIYAIFRALSGLGAGLVMISFSLLISRDSHPDRTMAQAYFAAGLIFSLYMWLAGLQVQTFGLHGLLWLLIVTGVSLVFLFCLIPNRNGVQKNPGTDVGQEDKPDLGLKNVSWHIVVLFLAGTAILAFVETGTWSFAERVGQTLSIATDRIGLTLAVANFAILLGAAVVTVLGAGQRRRVLLLTGVLLTGLSCAVTVGATNVPVYSGAVIAYGFAYGFVTPYLIGTGAKLDRRGRVVAWANSAIMIASAMAPWIAGLIIETLSYGRLSLILAVLTVIALTCFNPVCSHIQKHRELQDR